jgi:ABC-type nitrate/sulfonate/bicarbonate transport system ATPase subunit
MKQIKLEKMTTNGALHIRNVSKRYRVQESEIHVLDNFSLTIKPGEFVSIVGLSGCGKTTLLRHIVGLEPDYDGDIIFNGRRLDAPGLDRGIVFQDHRLFPWLTVEKNVALGLVGKSEKEKEKIVASHLELVGLKKGSRKAIRISFRAACRSERLSQGRWSTSRISCCLTSLSARLTP